MTPCVGSRHRPLSRLSDVAAAVLLCLALLAGVAPAVQASPEVSADPQVQLAGQELDAARRRLAALSAELDTAAAAFEHAHAHALRLDEELAAAGAAVRSAEARVDVAAAAFDARVAEVYKRPGDETALAVAVVAAPDAATALHRAALLERLATGEAAAVAGARAAAGYVADLAAQQRVVRTGAAGAAAERRLAADALAATVATARAEFVAAEDAVQAALREALRRAEEQARAARAAAERQAAERQAAERQAAERQAAERRAAAARTAGAAPGAFGIPAAPPTTDGRVCPIGAPNGFIDSWGFPRSGGRRHQGVDMFAAYGAPLYAVADGTVRRVFNNRLGGLSIDLVDDRGDRYYYAHLSAVSVVGGQRVAAGDVVGANGDSGNARGTPPHLHWQYHPGAGPPVNPYPLARALCRA